MHKAWAPVRRGLWALAVALSLAVWQAFAQAPATRENTSAPPPSTTALQVYAQQKAKLVQVRVLLAAANEQSTLGSAFAVREDARGIWFISNYHVVSKLAVEPQKYRIELRNTSGQSEQAQLMGIDVINDLAVLLKPGKRSEPQGAAQTTLKLQSDKPQQGAKVFALGNPLELGFLVAEGLYNGLVERSLYERMLFSGSLNSGMSGGPALDAAGSVVGINVAARRDGEQLSFLVPARYAVPLLAKAVQQDKPSVDWRDEITKQLLEHQKTLSQAVFKDGFPSQSLGDTPLPTMAQTLTRCWADSRDEQLKYTISTLSCNKPETLFVRDNLRTGSITLNHTLLTNTQLATAQFLNATDQRHQYGTSDYHRWTSRRELGQAECHDAFVSSGNGRRVYRVATCVSAYKKFVGLYDFDVSAVQVDDTTRRLTSKLSIRGFSFANATRLSGLFLKGLP
jgi:serine protease Do